MSHTVTLFPRAVDEFTLIEYACNKGHCLCVCVCQLDRVIFCVFLPADKELYLQNLPLYFPAGELSHKHAYSCIHTQTHTLTHKHSPIYSDDSSAQLILATYTNRDTHNGVINTLDHPLCAICTSSTFTHTHDH